MADYHDLLEIMKNMRAMRRLDQLRQAQKETVGLNRGGYAGLYENPANGGQSKHVQGVINFSL